MTLALEPLHPMVAGDRAVILSLSHANTLCERLGGGIGIVADAYHIWWDERLEQNSPARRSRKDTGLPCQRLAGADTACPA